jgi:hypothetical protein
MRMKRWVATLNRTLRRTLNLHTSSDTLNRLSCNDIWMAVKRGWYPVKGTRLRVAVKKAIKCFEKEQI